MQPNKPIQDITPPANAPHRQGPAELIQAEIEHAIPLRSQGEEKKDAVPASTGNPIENGKQFVETDKKDDKDIVKVLIDVSKGVKQDKQDNPKKKGFFAKKNNPAAKIPKPQKPIVLTAVAFFVAGCLSAAAVMAFKPTTQTSNQTNQNVPGKVGTSSEASDAVQAAGGTLVSPGDLTDLANLFESELNELNESQDFNSTDLSDKNLGL
jgi:hypothetical protein